MNRNNGCEIAERLHLLWDCFIKHADRTHAVSMADLQRHLSNEGYIGGNGVALDKKTIYGQIRLPCLIESFQSHKKAARSRMLLAAFSYLSCCHLMAFKGL